MPYGVPVTPATFAGVQNVDIDGLSILPESELRPILPCLVRMSLCAPLDASSVWTQERKKILKCLSGIEIVNSLVGLLSIDFHELEQDARKELQLRLKILSYQFFFQFELVMLKFHFMKSLAVSLVLAIL